MSLSAPTMKPWALRRNHNGGSCFYLCACACLPPPLGLYVCDEYHFPRLPHWCVATYSNSILSAYQGRGTCNHMHVIQRAVHKSKNYPALFTHVHRCPVSAGRKNFNGNWCARALAARAKYPCAASALRREVPHEEDFWAMMEIQLPVAEVVAWRTPIGAARRWE